MDIKNLTLKQKIAQMFVTGFVGNDYTNNEYFKTLLKNALGGVIFFTHNITSAADFKQLIENLKKETAFPMFFSIDQEGGRVERTENIHNGKKYLSAKFAYEKGLDFLKNQTDQIAEELLSFGINMNFAPVLDVNTNEKNPIIGERAFSNNADEVIEASNVVLKEYFNNKIITVGKHFPGHGAACADSHKTLPVIDVPLNELENIHLKPFKAAIKAGMPAIMAAHVLYPALEKENLPASVSKKIINDLLIEKLGFQGVVMTDDMEMNGIKGFTKTEACILAINAGVSMFIFRDTTKEILELVEELENAVKQGIILEEKINLAVEKIYNLKKSYGIAR